MPQTASFDTKQFRWADMQISLFGAIMLGARRVTYKVSQDDELIYAAGDEPVEIGSGNRKYEGEVTMLKSELDSLTKSAQTAGFGDILGLRFPVIITYANDTSIITDTLINCKFSEYNDGMSQGDKFGEVSLPFMFTRIKKGL